MRTDATKAETLLWQALRNKQLEGLKFKRQVPLDGYILDFVCFEARLIVEVGSTRSHDAMPQGTGISKRRGSGRSDSGTTRSNAISMRCVLPS